MANSQITPPSGIKVFRLNDCDWYAGAGLEECIEHYMKDMRLSREEAADADARELTEADMQRLKFVDGEPGEKHARRMTFKERLAEMVADGASFPCFFASTEY